MSEFFARECQCAQTFVCINCIWHMYVLIRTHTHTHMHIHMNTHTYKYTYTYTIRTHTCLYRQHIHVHTYTQADPPTIHTHSSILSCGGVCMPRQAFLSRHRIGQSPLALACGPSLSTACLQSNENFIACNQTETSSSSPRAPASFSCCGVAAAAWRIQTTRTRKLCRCEQKRACVFTRVRVYRRRCCCCCVDMWHQRHSGRATACEAKSRAHAHRNRSSIPRASPARGQRPSKLARVTAAMSVNRNSRKIASSKK